MTELRGGRPYERLVSYLTRNYPSVVTAGRFGLWSLGILRRRLTGIGGIAILVVVGLLVAGALVPPLRWYLVALATLILLACGALLALSYARAWVNLFVSEQRKQVSDSKATLAKMNVANFALFQPFNRRLTDEDLKLLSRGWTPRLGLNLDARALAYIAHRICLAEDSCIGRLGGDIETMLLRIMVARSVKERKLEVLEIGTLFGVGAAIVHENCRPFFSDVHVTVIDPLSGYYSASELDIVTSMPVSRDVFVRNMERMSIPETDYTIIDKLSTEDEALGQASKRRYDVVIIDGDHSYSGAKHDLLNYGGLVKRGGYIIFDDYGNPRFPGVKDFVDTEVTRVAALELVGTDVNTAVFRKTAPSKPIISGPQAYPV